MKKAERVECALKHQTTDIIPYQLELAPETLKRMAAYLGDKYCAQDWNAQHIANLMYTGRPTPVENREGFFCDEYGVTWDRTGDDKELGIMETLRIPDICKNEYTFAPLNREGLRRDYATFFASIDDRFPVAGLGLAAYERAWTLCGIENVLYAMDHHPGALASLFEDILANALEVVDTAAEFGFKAFFVGDDWTDGPCIQMGAAHWRTFIKPVLCGIYARAHTHGMFAMQHSCGNIAPLLPDLIEIGLDCYQTVQPEVYDMAFLKKEYGADLTFWGGISTKKYLPQFDARQARQHAVEIMRLMGKNGGYIAAPSHVLTPNIQPETILAILDVFQNQDRYL